MKKLEIMNMNCSHLKDTEIIENLDFCYRGRIDHHVCIECGEVIRKEIVR